MSNNQIEEALNNLEQPDESGYNVADHISELLLHLAETRPNDALEQFEEYSKKLKRSPPPQSDEQLVSEKRVCNFV